MFLPLSTAAPAIRTIEQTKTYTVISHHAIMSRNTDRRPRDEHRDATMETPNYRPIFLRWPFFVVFTSYVIFLIGILEWGCRSLPAQHGVQEIPAAQDPSLEQDRDVFFTTQLVQARQTPMSTTLRSNSAYMTRDTNITVNGTVLRPPVAFAGRQAYAPEWLEYLQTGNQSQGWNHSSLQPRIPGPSKHGQLTGPTIGLVWMLSIRGGSTVFNYRDLDAEFEATASDKDCRDVVTDGIGGAFISAGAITCNAGSFVFHNDNCWKRWKQSTDMEKKSLDQGGCWVHSEIDVRAKKGGSRMPCDTVDGVPGLALHGNCNPVTTTLTERDERGSPTATATVQMVVFTLKNADGTPYTTSTALGSISAPTESPTLLLTTLSDSRGWPTATLSAQLYILTDSNGVPFTTSTRYLSDSVVTLRDGRGAPTATVTVGRSIAQETVPLPGGITSVVTLTDAKGSPTATVTEAAMPSASTFLTDGSGFYMLTNPEYWATFFTPVLSAILLSILAEMLLSNLTALLPFHRLTKKTPDGGATAAQSLVLPHGLFGNALTSLRIAREDKDPLPLLAHLLVLLSAVATALSSEAVGIRLAGHCKHDDFSGCYIGVGVFLAPARALQAILTVELAMVVGAAGLLLLPWNKWCSGVAGPQGGIAATAKLVQNGDLRGAFRSLGDEAATTAGGKDEISDQHVIDAFRGLRFLLGYFPASSKGGRREMQYGILVVEHDEKEMVASQSFRSRATLQQKICSAWKRTYDSRFGTLVKGALFRMGRGQRISSKKMYECCGLLYMAGLIILVTYYTAIQDPDTVFEKFMNQQDFGVRVLFTGFGVVLTSFWDAYYAREFYSCILPP